MKKFSLAYYIFEKDFIESVKNKTVLFSILFPVILSLVFSVVLKPKEISKLNLAIIDHGKSKIAGALQKMGNLREELSIYDYKDLEPAKVLLRQGEVQAIMVFPSGFDESLETGKDMKIDFWVGESGLKTSEILKNEMNKVLYYCKYEKLPPDFFRLRSLYGKTYSPQTAMLPTWILFTVIGGYMVVSSSIMEEKEKKTLEAILVSPCRMPEIVMGKGFLGVFLAMTGSMMILALNNGFIGNIPMLVLFILLGSISFALLGVLAGLVFPSQTTISTFGSLMFLVMFMPVSLAPASAVMRTFARLLPSYYIQNGVNDSMFAGIDASAYTTHIGYLLIFTTLLFLANLVVLGRKKD